MPDTGIAKRRLVLERRSSSSLRVRLSSDCSAGLEFRMMEPATLKKINKYDVVDLIGRGGMGVVYKALDRSLDRMVAIKMVTSTEDDGGELVKRFHREAQFTANLHHPNIVTVYDQGDFEGRPYLVMEYLPPKP
jgi:serine/threonine protein kinase